VDIDEATHGIDVTQAVVARLQAGQPQNARQNPVASWIFLTQGGLEDLSRRASRHEHGIFRLAGTDFGAYLVPAARGLLAAIYFAHTLAARGNPGLHKHLAGLIGQAQCLGRDMDFDQHRAGKLGAADLHKNKHIMRSFRALEQRHRLDVTGLREHVHDPGSLETVALQVYQHLAVARQGRRIAGHIDDAMW